jgi:hypothetical protein
MSVDWRKKAFLNFKDWYFRRWGREFKGEWLSPEDLKIEMRIVIWEGMDRNKIYDWDGQESADLIYEGEWDEKKLDFLLKVC